MEGRLLLSLQLLPLLSLADSANKEKLSRGKILVWWPLTHFLLHPQAWSTLYFRSCGGLNHDKSLKPRETPADTVSWQCTKFEHFVMVQS